MTPQSQNYCRFYIDMDSGHQKRYTDMNTGHHQRVFVRQNSGFFNQTNPTPIYVKRTLFQRRKSKSAEEFVPGAIPLSKLFILYNCLT